MGEELSIVIHAVFMI